MARFETFEKNFWKDFADFLFFFAEKGKSSNPSYFWKLHFRIFFRRTRFSSAEEMNSLPETLRVEDLYYEKQEDLETATSDYSGN